MESKKNTPIFDLIQRISKENEQILKEIMDFCKSKNLKIISDLLRYSEIELQLFFSQEAYFLLKKVLHDEYNLAFSEEPLEKVKEEAGLPKDKEEKVKTRSGGGAPPINQLSQGRYGIGGPGFSGFARKLMP